MQLQSGKITAGQEPGPRTKLSMPISHNMSKTIQSLRTCICYQEKNPPAIRRDVCAKVERQKQSNRETHALFGQIPATKRLKSRHCILSSVQSENFPAKVITCNEWRFAIKPHISIINLHERIANGYDSPWTTWKFLNRQRTGYTCSKRQRKKWKFYTEDTTCACGRAEETTAHMLQCSQVEHACSLDDLITFNDVGKQRVELWKKIV